MKATAKKRVSASEKREADEKWRRQDIADAYDRPFGSLGRQYGVWLIRDLNAASMALSKANAALAKGDVHPNKHGIECMIAALTRVVELARVFPQSLNETRAQAEENIRLAEAVVVKCRETIKRISAEESNWIESALSIRSES